MKHKITLYHLKSKLCKYSKSIVAIVLSAVMVVSIFASVQFVFPTVADAVSDTSQTEYANIAEFQKARWAEIQNEIFGGDRTTPEIASSVLNKEVVPDNEYFNWTDTGLSAWNGDSTKFNKTRNETIDFDGVSVNFDVYDVTTPAQLRYILNTFSADQKLYSGFKYIKVNILNDLDMGGQNGKVWEPIVADYARDNNYKSYLYIEGNGNTIYNLKMYTEDINTACGIFSTPPAFMSVKNLGFYSTMALHGLKPDQNGQYLTNYNSIGLIAGMSPANFYLYNVHSETAYFQATDVSNTNHSGSGIGGLFGRHPSKVRVADTLGDRFYKNCSTSKYLMYGSDHIGGIASTQNTSTATLYGRYDSKIPEVPEKYIFKPVDYLAVSGADQTKLILENNEYPNMFEDCYSTDCELFSVGHDSGGFVSCGLSIIANNCFTNNTIYSQDNTGGFIGRSTNSENLHTIKDENGNYTITNSYNNCYSTGIVEGENAMGGFVGLVNMRRDKNNITAIGSGKTSYDDRGVSVFRNCYSTSMVGIDYAGKYCGGFVGFDGSYGLGNLNATTAINANGQVVSGRGSFYVNCYSAGEVGNILTVTDTLNTYESAYLDPENGGEGKNTSEEILPYYPTGGFAGAIGFDLMNKANYPDLTQDLANIEGTGNFYNCYYDMQTTAMREMAVGMSRASVSGSSDGEGVADEPYSLKGVKGLYTEKSDRKKIDGLTDMQYMEPNTEDSDLWQYVDQYYPQLKVYMASDMDHTSIEEATKECIDDKVKGSTFFVPDSGNDVTNAKYAKPVLSLAGVKNKNIYAAQMASLVHAYRFSQASTATVLLDHWDVTMNTSTGAESGETNWNCGLPQNRMYKTDKTVEIDGKEVPIYAISYKGLASGKYEFKIQSGTGWAYNYGVNGFNGNNFTLVVNKDNTEVDICFAYNGLGSNNYYVYADFVERDLADNVTATYTKVFHDLPSSGGGYQETPWTIAGSFSMMTWYPNSDFGLKMAYSGNDGLYSYTFENLAPSNSTVDGSTFEFKITDGSGWSVNYGKNGDKDGANMTFKLLGVTDVTITFDENTHYTYVTASDSNLISNIDVGSSVPSISYKGYSVISASRIFTGFEWFKNASTGYEDVQAAAVAGGMTYDDTLGHYVYKTTVAAEYLNATYGYKVIQDATDSGVNRAFYLPAVDNSVESVEVVFHFDPTQTADSDKHMWVTCNEPSIADGVLQYAKIFSYSVAGAEGLTGFNWLTDAPEGSEEQKAASASGQMVFDPQLNLYKKTYYNVSAGTYDFKVLGNGVWSTGVSYGSMSGNNYEIQLTETADVTIYFNPNSTTSSYIYVESNPQGALVRNNYVVSATSNLTKYFGIQSSPSAWNNKEPVMNYNISDDVFELWVTDVPANDEDLPSDPTVLGNYSYAYSIVQQNGEGGNQITFSLNNKYAEYDLRFVYEERTGLSSVEVYNPDDHTDLITDSVLTYNPPPVFYSVLGDNDLTGYNWASVTDSEADRAAAAAAGLMKVNRQLSTAEYTVREVTFHVDDIVMAPAITTLSFKVVANGTWDSGVDYGLQYKGNNAVVNLSTPEGFTNQECDVKIFFKLYNDSNEFEIYYEAIGADGTSYNGEFDETTLSWYICGESGLYSNNLISDSDPKVYDTIRDIMSDFTFTCGLGSEERGLIWDKNDLRNAKFKDKDTFELDYSIQNNDIHGTFNADVLDLEVKAIYDDSYDNGNIAETLCAQYFVDDFAPGKQWIEVNTVGYGYDKKYKEWETHFIAYNEYLDLVEKYEANFNLYLHEAMKFIYKGKEVNSSTLIEFLEYEQLNRPDIYEGFVEQIGTDLLADKKYLEDNKVEEPEASPTVDEQTIIGNRKIRLIPTAYLEAGNDAQIGVLQSASDLTGKNVSNAVSYSDDSRNQTSFLVGDKTLSSMSFDYYNPALTAGYLITDKIGLGIYNNYMAQTIQKYDKDKVRNEDELASRVSGTYYAMSAVFNQKSAFTDGGGAATAIQNGLDVGRFTPQSLIGSSYNNANLREAEVNYAQSIIKVYKVTYDENGDEASSTIVPLDYTYGASGTYAQNYKKWTGQTKFNAADTGNYKLVFYWTLADGRYLSDTKYVNVTVLEPGLTKDVDREWDSAGENEINYTITYTNDRTDYSLDFTLLDILPFKGDYREYTPESQSDFKKALSTNADVDFTLESLNITQSGKSIVRGVYYATYDPNDSSGSVPIRELGTSNIQAAKALGLSDDGLLLNADEYNFKEADMHDDELTASYGNDAYIDFRKHPDGTDGEGIKNCAAVAITGLQLARGQSVSFTFKLKYTGKAQDFIANNATYYLKSAEEGASEEDEAFYMCDPVSTAIVSRSISGYAWYDSDADNVIDENEPRIKNLGVKLQRFNSNKVYSDVYAFVDGEPIIQYTTTTDENGYYEVKNVPQGMYKVVFYDLDNPDKEVTLLYSDGRTKTIEFDHLYNTNVRHITERDEVDWDKGNGVGTRGYAMNEEIASGDSTIKAHTISAISLPTDKEVKEGATNTNGRTKDYLYTKAYQSVGFTNSSASLNSLNLYKVGEEDADGNDTPLENVEFKLEYLYVDESTNTTKWLPVYMVTDDIGNIRAGIDPKTESELDAEGISYTYTTDETGRLSINGLFDAKYRLTEVRTADDYILLQSPIEFNLPYAVSKDSLKEFIENGGVADNKNVDSLTYISGDYISEDDENYYYNNISMKIKNSKQLLLPMTGFGGLSLIIGAGIAILSIAVFLFYMSCKKSKKKIVASV